VPIWFVWDDGNLYLLPGCRLPSTNLVMARLIPDRRLFIRNRQIRTMRRGVVHDAKAQTQSASSLSL
jgi:hypothetical protein